MTGKIVVATDGSDTGNRAVEFAAAMSNKFDQDLVLVHVLMYGRPAKEFARLAEVEGLLQPNTPGHRTDLAALAKHFPTAEDELAMAQAVSALGDHIMSLAKSRAQEAGARNIKTEICAGDIADEILDVVETEKPEVLVVGRRGLGRVREALLGSVSQKVLHHAGRTVVIVQ